MIENQKDQQTTGHGAGTIPAGLIADLLKKFPGAQIHALSGMKFPCAHCIATQLIEDRTDADPTDFTKEYLIPEENFKLAAEGKLPEKARLRFWAFILQAATEENAELLGASGIPFQMQTHVMADALADFSGRVFHWLKVLAREKLGMEPLPEQKDESLYEFAKKFVAAGLGKFTVGDLLVSEGLRATARKISSDGRSTEADQFATKLAKCNRRHTAGDWGDLSDEDKRANDEAVKNGGRIVSKYNLDFGSIYIVTEADRSTTTMMLADEY